MLYNNSKGIVGPVKPQKGFRVAYIIIVLGLIAPVLNGVPQPKYNKTSFLNWIPHELVEDRGYMKASDF